MAKTPPVSTPYDDEPEEKLTLRQRFASLRHIVPFLKLLAQTSPPLFWLNVALRVVRAVVPVAVLWVGKLILDEVVLLVGTPAPRDYTALITWVALELALAALNEVLQRVNSVVDTLLGDRFTNESSVRIMQHAATLDLAQFEDARFYDKLERARRQTMGRTALMNVLLMQAQEFLMMFFLSVALIVFNPWLVLLLVVAIIPAIVADVYFNAKAYTLARGFTPQRRLLDYLRYVGASDETAKELKLFGLSDFLTARFRQLSDSFYYQTRRLSVRRAAWGSLFGLLGIGAFYGAYAVMLADTVAGTITLGSLVFLSGSFQRLRFLVEQLLTRFSNVTQEAMYLADFFEFFELKPNIRRPAIAVTFPTSLRQGWAFENVGFKYPDRELWALRGLDFTLEPREKLALVGENGSGKTTLVKLLVRLYDPTEGTIWLEGRDLRDYDPQDLWQHTGVIFQDFIRYQMTAATNLAVGRIAPYPEQPEVQLAAEQSLAHDVITRLPKGYNNLVGRRFKGGAELSGGEWQKLALGRAYLRHAQLLILDEPTAALDARAEHEVFQRFVELTQGRTAVLISHRFSTVRMADRILVLDKGRLLELGTHAELLALGGRYAELFSLQAAGYR